jgi:DNA-binding MarR family transcriptional regulator
VSASSRPSLPPALPCTCAELRRAARAVTQAYDDALRPSGIRVTQFTLLQVLARARSLTQAALGEFLAIDSTTLTRTLRPLAQAGWIGAVRGADRRERHLALTAAGRRVFARATPAWESAQRRLRDRLGERDWATLRAVLPAATRAAHPK